MATIDKDDRKLVQVWTAPAIVAAVDEAAKGYDLTRSQFLRVLFAEAPKFKLERKIIYESQKT